MSEPRPPRLDRDGTSLFRAVRVTNAAEEWTWLRRHYPGLRFKQQYLIGTQDWAYDLLTIDDALGEQHQVWFRLLRTPR